MRKWQREGEEREVANIWSGEYWAKKGDVDLNMYRKRPGPPDGTARPVLFLVHGSSVCSRTTFDLTVPGKPGYSTMDWFAERGFDVWTVDHENYGLSSRTDSNSDIAGGVDDLDAAIEVVARETGLRRYHFMGTSSGALRAGGFANRRPERVDRLVLDAFVWTGEGSPTLARRREGLAQFRASPVRKVDRAFFHSIFNRDKPGLVEDGIADAFADAELQYGDTMPTGTYLDMCANLPVVDPAKLSCSVLIVRGEHDGIASEDDLRNFFGRLDTTDKAFVVIPGQAHVGNLGVNRHRFLHVIHGFLTMPPRQDAAAR
jgi:pimeloyl-ACP methyl ester carboxylesterase